MATVQTYDAIIARISNGYSRLQPIYSYRSSSGSLFSTAGMTSYQGTSQKMPASLPSGVTSFFATAAWNTGGMANPVATGVIVVCKRVNMGSLNIATPAFTDGAAMPTATELNASNAVPGILIGVATTALTGTPGTITVTYVDQDGNSAETTTGQALSAVPAGSAGLILLNTTDWGVRDVTAATRTGGTTPAGTITFYGLIPIGVMNASYNSSSGIEGTGGVFNGLTDGFIMTQLGAGDEIACLHVFSSTGGNNAYVGAVQIIGDS